MILNCYCVYKEVLKNGRMRPCKHLNHFVTKQPSLEGKLVNCFFSKKSETGRGSLAEGQTLNIYVTVYILVSKSKQGYLPMLPLHYNLQVVLAWSLCGTISQRIRLFTKRLVV